MGWTKIQQVALDKGVSERAVYKMLAKYREQIGENHIHKDGNNGTYLDEEAVAFLSERMRDRQSVVVYDEEQDEERKRLIAENRELRVKLDAAQELIIDKAEKLEAVQLKLIDAQQQMLQIADDNAKAIKEIEAVRQQVEDDAKKRVAAAEEEVKGREGECEELRAEIERLKNRTLWERIRNK